MIAIMKNMGHGGKLLDYAETAILGWVNFALELAKLGGPGCVAGTARKRRATSWGRVADDCASASSWLLQLRDLREDRAC
jgi:hypothetical protein